MQVNRTNLPPNKRNSFWLLSALLPSLIAAAIPCTSDGATITVDEVMFQGNPSNGAILTGTVDMTVSGNMLTIVLTNTSTTASLDGGGAFNLLTGVGFTMPDGFEISGGTATVEAGSQVGSWNTNTTDVSNEWGFSEAVDMGHFDGSPSVFSYQQVVGTLNADIDVQFAAGSNGNPPNLDGPDFGLLSKLVNASVASGQTSAQSPLTVVLTLNQSVGAGEEADFLAFIEDNPVGISFASPDQSNVNIPEPATGILMLLALAAFFARWR